MDDESPYKYESAASFIKQPLVILRLACYNTTHVSCNSPHTPKYKPNSIVVSQFAKSSLYVKEKKID